MVLTHVSDAEAVRIERFAPRFAVDVSRLNREWIVGHFDVKAIDEAFFQDPAAEVIARGGEIFCALMGDAVVGCACVAPSGDGSMTLTKVAVMPAAQGRGIGRRLCAAAVEFARERDADRVILWSNSGLRAALHLYHALGFAHRPPPVAAPHGDADVYMELDLGSSTTVSRSSRFV